MAVDLGFTAVVNAAGGLLFLVVGAAILVLGRAARTGRMFGGFAMVFGAHYVASNVYAYDPDAPELFAAAIGTALAAGTGLLAMLVARDELRSASRRARRAVVAIGLVASALIGAAFATVTIHPELALISGAGAGPLAAGYNASLFFGDIGLLILLAAGVQRVRATPHDAPRERRAALLRTLAFGLYIVFFVVGIALRPAPRAIDGADLVNWLALAYGLVPVICVLPLLGATPEEPKLARRALLALLSAGLLAVVMTLALPAVGLGVGDYGAHGIMRTIGVVLLAIAVLRYDLLGVPLPRLVVRRGSLATAALAALLIVAQVAQNFLTAQYSLLMGGIVSGALIFAATPLQRAMERRREEDPRVPQSAAVLTYRAAVRAALDDGVMTPREEEHLAEVAHHLRLSPLDALKLRREIEHELGQRRG